MFLDFPKIDFFCSWFKFLMTFLHMCDFISPTSLQMAAVSSLTVSGLSSYTLAFTNSHKKKSSKLRPGKCGWHILLVMKEMCCLFQSFYQSKNLRLGKITIMRNLICIVRIKVIGVLVLIELNSYYMQPYWKKHRK